MTGRERKAALGYGALSKIARRTRRTLGHVSQVIDGTRRDPVVERATAARLGKSIDEVFGERPAKAGAA